MRCLPSRVGVLVAHVASAVGTGEGADLVDAGENPEPPLAPRIPLRLPRPSLPPPGFRTLVPSPRPSTGVDFFAGIVDAPAHQLHLSGGRQECRLNFLSPPELPHP
jgi:hypothetical protein